MHESVLRDFLLGSQSAAALKKDLAGVVVQTSSDVFTQHVTPMKEELVITRDHALRLCEAVLDGSLAPEDLEAAKGVMLYLLPLDLLGRRRKGSCFTFYLLTYLGGWAGSRWLSPLYESSDHVGRVAGFQLGNSGAGRTGSGRCLLIGCELPSVRKLTGLGG